MAGRDIIPSSLPYAQRWVKYWEGLAVEYHVALSEDNTLLTFPMSLNKHYMKKIAGMGYFHYFNEITTYFSKKKNLRRYIIKYNRGRITSDL